MHPSFFHPSCHQLATARTHRWDIDATLLFCLRCFERCCELKTSMLDKKYQKVFNKSFQLHMGCDVSNTYRGVLHSDVLDTFMFWTPLDTCASFSRPFLLLKSWELVRHQRDVWQTLAHYWNVQRDMTCVPTLEHRACCCLNSFFLRVFGPFEPKGSASSGIAINWILGVGNNLWHDVQNATKLNGGTHLIVAVEHDR